MIKVKSISKSNLHAYLFCERKQRTKHILKEKFRRKENELYQFTSQRYVTKKKLIYNVGESGVS